MNASPCKPLTFVCLFVASLLSTSSLAEIYKSIDKQGNVSYSDSPSSSAEAVKLPPLPVLHIKPSPQIPALTKEKTAPSEALSPYQSLIIKKPLNDEAFQSSSGEINVALSMQPELFADDSIVITLDGRTVYQGTAGAMALNDVARGTHTLQASIVNKKGKALIQSKAVIFHLLKPSLLHRPSTP